MLSNWDGEDYIFASDGAGNVVFGTPEQTIIAGKLVRVKPGESVEVRCYTMNMPKYS